MGNYRSSGRAGAMTFSCSGGGHIGLFATRPPGDTSTCLRCFLETLYRHLSPCHISQTCHQVHDFINYYPAIYRQKASAKFSQYAFCDGRSVRPSVSVRLHACLVAWLAAGNIREKTYEWLCFTLLKPGVTDVCALGVLLGYAWLPFQKLYR